MNFERLLDRSISNSLLPSKKKIQKTALVSFMIHETKINGIVISEFLEIKYSSQSINRLDLERPYSDPSSLLRKFKLLFFTLLSIALFLVMYLDLFNLFPTCLYIFNETTLNPQSLRYVFSTLLESPLSINTKLSYSNSLLNTLLLEYFSENF